MTAFASIIAAGLESIRAATATRVTYHRGTAWVRTTATQGRTKFDVTDSAGAVIQSRSIDFILPAEELVLAGQLVTPKRGDRVKVPAARGKVNVFEVMRPDGSEDVWRYVDPACTTVRIHTHLVGVEDAP